MCVFNKYEYTVYNLTERHVCMLPKHYFATVEQLVLTRTNAVQVLMYTTREDLLFSLIIV